MIKGLLADGYFGGFAFDEEYSFAVFVEGDDVAAFGEAVDRNCFFYGEECLRVLFFGYQIVKQVLSDPFFGGDDDPFFAAGIEYLLLSIECA